MDNLNEYIAYAVAITAAADKIWMVVITTIRNMMDTYRSVFPKVILLTKQNEYRPGMEIKK